MRRVFWRQPAAALRLLSVVSLLLPLTVLAQESPFLAGMTSLQANMLEFLALLVNGEWQRMPLPRAPIAETFATTRPLFGFEAIEYRMPTSTRLGAMLGIIDCATPTVFGLLGPLLSAPFSRILTQSFAFPRKPTAQGLTQRQHHGEHSAGDFAVSRAEELHQALDRGPVR